MFKKARIKLTFWYLLIIMSISIFFSILIYAGATEEYDRILRAQQYRIEHPEIRIKILPQNVWDEEPQLPGFPAKIDTEVITFAKLRVLEALFGINIVILIFSTLSGYFLAGRTLRPIKEMVDEQNRFITDASHELNTPLTSLKTSLEVSLRDKNLTSQKARKLFISNLEDVNGLQLLSDELIKLSQYQKANGNVYFEKLNLRDVVNFALDKISPQANKKHIKISVSIPKISLFADEKSLSEVFVILLDNAVKYSNEKSEVFIKAKKQDSKIEIIVEDNGTGIPKEDLPLIFDRFFRSEKSRTKTNYSGYGLGLSIAKRIVTLHKGTIHVESKVSKGTKFVIILNAIT